MIQAVKMGVGGLIEARFLGGRPTSVALNVYNGKGELKVTAGVATLDSVNTTLSAPAAKGALTLTLTSATGVIVGTRYLVGSLSGTEAPETITVKSVAGSVATLWAPLMNAHSSGSAFAGTRATYTMNGSEANVLWWDGFADWTATGGTGETITEVVDCALRPVPKNLIDEVHVRSIFANAHAILPATLDMQTALLDARDEFLRRLGGKNRAHASLGADHFRLPCARVFWLQRRYDLGDPYSQILDKLGEELSVNLSEMNYQVPYDNNQDGKTTGPTDGAYIQREVGRAM